MLFYIFTLLWVFPTALYRWVITTEKIWKVWYIDALILGALSEEEVQGSWHNSVPSEETLQ